MTPLHVVAELATPIAITHPIALDSVLAWAVVQRDGIEPALTIADMVPIEIPVQLEPAGRFHLCSHSVGVADEHELRHQNRRPVVAEAQLLGSPKLRRMDISAGPSKGYHVPMHVSHVPRLDWWCVGEREEIADLLALVGYVGRRRAVGLGRVTRWKVEECVPWDEGFPVVSDGIALRPLPTDWPGLAEPKLRQSVLSYPYDQRRWGDRGQLCAVPG